MSGDYRREEDLAYGGDEQEEGERGFIGDTVNKFLGRRPQQYGQQSDITQTYQPQLYSQGSQQQQQPYGRPSSGYNQSSSSQQKPPGSSSGGSFIFDKLSDAIHDISSDFKTKLSGPGLVHSHTHQSAQCGPNYHDGYKGNRYLSFAPERQGNDAKWYVDACGYMWAVSMALETARESIWILDWWLSPELYLRRPPARNEQYRLDRMLKAAAERGVKVNVIVYKEVTQALTLCSYHTKHALEDLHPNIAVLRHPDHLPDSQTLQSSFMSSLQNFRLTAASAGQLPGDALQALYGVNEDTVLYWAHHEKLCLVDGRVAFMGGIDLCYGRWDTNQHSIADVHPGDISSTVFPGQDYNNARIMDFQDVTHWQNNKLDRTQEPRMGWSDLSISLTGPVVDDLREHFAQRWNFIYYQKYDVRKDTRYKPLAWIAPPGIAPSSYPKPKQSQQGQQPQPQQAQSGPSQQSYGYDGTQQSTSFPPPPTQAGQSQYQGSTTGTGHTQYQGPPAGIGQTQYQGAPAGVPSESGKVYPAPPGQTSSSVQGQSGYPGSGAYPQSSQTGGSQPYSSQGGGYTQGSDQNYPPPPPGGPSSGQSSQAHGSAPPTQGGHQYGNQGQQPYGPPGSQDNPPYFSPPPTQATRGLDDEGYGERGLGEEVSGDRGLDEFDGTGDRAFSGRSGRRPGGGNIRDELRQRLDSGMQQLDSRYGSRIQSGLQKIDDRFGTRVGSQYAGLQSQVSGPPRGVGVSCQIVRSCARWSHGVPLEHSIANAYIDVIRRSQHFIYIENQFFITATDDKQSPIKNKIASAIVERVIRAARQGQKFKIIVVIPGIPGFAGDLRSDDALGTRAIMEFQYNSISRGGYSIYQSLAREGVNPVDYIRFYNLRNYDRINTSLAFREAEAQSGVPYSAAQQQYDAAYGADFPGTAPHSMNLQGASPALEGSRGLDDQIGDYEQSRAYGSNQDLYGAAAAQGQGQAAGANDSSWSLYAPPAGVSQAPTSGQQQPYAPYHPPQPSATGTVSPPPSNPDGRYSAYRPSTSGSGQGQDSVSPATPGTGTGYSSSQTYPPPPMQSQGAGYGSEAGPQGISQPQYSSQPVAELGDTSLAQVQRPGSGSYGPTGTGSQQTYSQQQAQTDYGQSTSTQSQGYGGPPQSQTAGYGQQPSTQQTGYGGAQVGQQTGYGAASQYQQGGPYQQYQAGAQQIGPHQGLGTSGRWDSVAECYMLNGEDIRKVPWEQGGVPEIDAFVTEELYIHSKILIADDRVAIIGSANLNDRSQLGDHDSEIACVIEDSNLIDSRMNGLPWKAGRFPASLRRSLARKHLGLLKPQNYESPDANFEPVSISPNLYDWDSPEDALVADPLAPTFENFWNTRAHTNTEVFAKVFHVIPYDGVRTWTQYEDWYERYFRAEAKDGKPAGRYKVGHVVSENYPSGEEGARVVKEELSRVKGTVVEMPLLFLKDEDIAREGLGLNAFTEEVYT